MLFSTHHIPDRLGTNIYLLRIGLLLYIIALISLGVDISISIQKNGIDRSYNFVIDYYYAFFHKERICVEQPEHDSMGQLLYIFCKKLYLHNTIYMIRKRIWREFQYFQPCFDMLSARFNIHTCWQDVYLITIRT